MLNENPVTQDLSLTAGATFSSISYADALENYTTNTDWWLVFDSFDLPNAIGSALWISDHLNLSDVTVNEALEGLVVLGLVARSQKGFEKIKGHFDFPRHPSKQKRMSDHSLVSRQVLNHVSEQSKGAFRVSSFASNNQIISEMYEKIHSAVLEADEKSKKLNRSEIENIYLSSITFVTAVQPKNTEGAKNV